ncbi:hypothetical protein [Brucella endophytica]|uniref:hypothetical protein n=1 Tax=Brucella endophytica TaxID=1963359 RepID=UPI00166E59B1|nr:hypothetical protein [Brucella endophytica]
MTWAYERKKLQVNERSKLLANNLDRLSTAFIVVGVLGNTFDFAPGEGLARSLFSAAAWILFAVGLHIAARQVLRNLKP